LGQDVCLVAVSGRPSAIIPKNDADASPGELARCSTRTGKPPVSCEADRRLNGHPRESVSVAGGGSRRRREGAQERLSTPALEGTLSRALRLTTRSVAMIRVSPATGTQWLQPMGAPGAAEGVHGACRRSQPQQQGALRNAGPAAQRHCSPHLVSAQPRPHRDHQRLVDMQHFD
jgi:hypothetical protein